MIFVLILLVFWGQMWPLSVLAAHEAPHAVQSPSAMPKNSRSLAQSKSGTEIPRSVEDLTNQVLLKEIDLERYYIAYRVFGSKEPKLRHLRYFLLQQAAAGLFLGSSIAFLAESGKHLKTPESVSARTFKGATRAGLFGAVFEGGSSGFEMSSNGFTALKNKFLKRDPATARKEVFKRLAEIDAFLARRALLVEQETDPSIREIWTCEGTVLKYFRDWCLYEFADVYCDVRSYQASNNVYYFLDAASCSVYLASYVLSLEAFKKPLLARNAAVTGIVGDSIGLASAPASTWCYNRIYNFWYRKLSKQLGEKPYDAEKNAKEEMARLAKLVSADGLNFASIRTRLGVYNLWADRYDKFIDKRMIDLRHIQKVAQQSNISGPAISGTFLAQDVMGTVVAYRFLNDPKKANNIGFASTIPTTAGSAASVALTTYWFIDSKLHERDLKAQDALPSDLLEKRLATLTELESMLSLR